MAEWLPMSSAPKDGTRILIARAGEDVGPDEIEITEWCVRRMFHYEPVEDGLFKRVEDEPYEFWNGNGHRATHWQMLPAPPETEANTTVVCRTVNGYDEVFSALSAIVNFCDDPNGSKKGVSLAFGLAGLLPAARAAIAKASA